MIKKFSADDARRLTDEKNKKVEDYISEDKINIILSKIETKISSYRDSNFDALRSTYRWDGSLTKGEQNYLKNEGYTINFDSDHGNSWYIIKW